VGYPLKMLSLKLRDSVLKSINQKMHVRGVFYDLAKAFDCVNHKIKTFKVLKEQYVTEDYISLGCSTT
jgi:hypothetical protein